MYQWKGLVTRNAHMKYQSPTSYGSKDMAKVKVFVTDGRTDELNLMSPRFRESGGQKYL